MGLLITKILACIGSQGADGEQVQCALRAPSLPPCRECSAFNKPDVAGATTDLMDPLQWIRKRSLGNTHRERWTLEQSGIPTHA